MANDRKRTRERRDDSFEEFVASRRRALVGFAYALTSDISVAEDIVAEAVARAWTSLRNRELDQVELSVRRIIVNPVTAHQRRRVIDQRHQPTARDDWRLAAVPGAVFDDTAVDHEDLIRALAALPISQRSVMVMRFLLDMTERDTADLLGVPKGTVKSRVARATASLRTALLRDREREGDPSEGDRS